MLSSNLTLSQVAMIVIVIAPLVPDALDFEPFIIPLPRLRTARSRSHSPNNFPRPPPHSSVGLGRKWWRQWRWCQPAICTVPLPKLKLISDWSKEGECGLELGISEQLGTRAERAPV